MASTGQTERAVSGTPSASISSLPRSRIPALPRRGRLLRQAVICGLLTLTLCTLVTWRLDAYAMEGIIALGGERMIHTGEWFVPWLYGTVHAYKPAMAYWLVGLSQHALGRSEFAMRLPTAVCAATLCTVLFWVLARLSTPRCGLFAAMALCFSGSFIQHARIADYDIPLALGVGIATLCAARNLVLRRASLAWWTAGYLGLAFAFLSKGLPAFGMFVPGLLVAALVLREWRQVFTWQHLVGAALGALVIGAYLYLAWLEAGSAAFGDQSSEVGQRLARWNWARFAQSLAKPVVIWCVFLPGSLLVPALPFLWQGYRSRMPLRVRRLTVALACFFLTGVVVWMLIPTVNKRYYLPLVVSVAGLAGVAAEALSINPFSRSIAQNWSASPARVRTAATPSFKALAEGLWHNYKVGLILALFGLVYWLMYAGYAQPAKARALSERAVAAAFAPHLTSQQTVYFNGFDGGSSLFYYLEHPVGRWDPGAPPVDDTFALVIDNDYVEQRSTLMSRTDIRVEILEVAKTAAGRTWELARVSRKL